MCVCMMYAWGHECVTACVWRSEDTFMVLVFSIHFYVSFRHFSRAARLLSKAFPYCLISLTPNLSSVSMQEARST